MALPSPVILRFEKKQTTEFNGTFNAEILQLIFQERRAVAKLAGAFSEIGVSFVCVGRIG